MDNPAPRKARRRRLGIAVLLCIIGVTLGLARDAHGMRRVRQPYPGPGASPTLEQAIALTWPDALHAQALNVGWCESRGKPTATNGRYRGLFQIGPREWAKYGDGNNIFDPVDNAAAAFRYYTDAGWKPWECAP